MKETITDNSKWPVRQKRLFWFTIFSFFLFALAWTVSTLRAYFSPNSHYGSYNFVFNIGFFIPVILLAVTISYFTLGLTLIYWKKLPNKKQKRWTVILTLLIISHFLYMIFAVFRVH